MVKAKGKRQQGQRIVHNKAKSNSEAAKAKNIRRVVSVGVVRNSALLQFENVVGLLERRARWQVGRRVEASGPSIRRLVHLSKHVGKSGGRFQVSGTSEGRGVGGILGGLEAIQVDTRGQKVSVKIQWEALYMF